MSSHPLTRHASLLQALSTANAADVAKLPEKTEVVLGGMIANIQLRNVQKSRSGHSRDGQAHIRGPDRIGFGGHSGPRNTPSTNPLVHNGLINFVRGTIDRRRDPAELIISRILPFEDGLQELVRGVLIRLHQSQHPEEQLNRLLRQVHGSRPGNLDVYFEVFGLTGFRPVVYKAGLLRTGSATILA